MKGRLVEAITLEAGRHYDLDAEGYAQVDEDPAIANSPIAAQLRGLCRLRPLENVAELGVGTGRYLPQVSGRGTFYGIDISAEMLKVAAGRQAVLGQGGFRGVELRQGDLMDFGRLTDLSFDLVYAIGVLGYHLPLTGAVLKVIGERLRPGGHFFVTTVQQGAGLAVKQALRRLAWRCRLKASPPLSSYACPPQRFPALAREAALDLVAVYAWPGCPWHGRPQCGGPVPAAGPGTVGPWTRLS